MLVQKFRLQYHVVGRLLLCKSLSSFSTKAAVQQPLAEFFVEYLVKSIGLSRKEAISVSNKVCLWKSTKRNPDLALNFFQEMGLNKTQIKSLVSSDPRLLFLDPNKIYRPKLQVLQDLGLSGSDLIRVIMLYKTYFLKGLDNHIKPCIEFWRKLLGSDENVAMALKKHARLLDYRTPQKMEEIVMLLREYGFSSKNVLKFIFRNSKLVMMHDLEYFQNILARVEDEFGIPRHSAMFYYGVEALSRLWKSTIEMKFSLLRSFGWTDEDAYVMFRNLPSILGMSEDNMRETLNFFMNEIGYTADYLASHPMLFCFSVDKRVKPRFEVIKFLDEKKLNNRNANLYTALCLSESEFLKRYLLPYKDNMPDLYTSYMQSIGK